MVRKKENAKIGGEAERLFASKLKADTKLQKFITRKYKLKGDFLEAHPTGINQKKSDVLVLFSESVPVGVNIKAGKADFNQVTRLWLSSLAKEIKLSKTAVSIFQKGIDNYRLKRKECLIEKESQPYIENELRGKLDLVIELIFRGIGNDIAKILALYDRTKKVYHLYDLDEFISKVARSKIGFTAKGIVKIGKYLSIQRKSGNGASVKVPKSHPKHPGNQIQFKMKILSFMHENKPFSILK
ncbi:MAG: hypothetical protein P9M06_02000 [Candidatus Saelkia tenebricola]|nr:hypothetical protein [Candidatus Saelkia tenebricola]